MLFVSAWQKNISYPFVPTPTWRCANGEALARIPVSPLWRFVEIQRGKKRQNLRPPFTRFIVCIRAYLFGVFRPLVEGRTKWGTKYRATCDVSISVMPFHMTKPHVLVMSPRGGCHDGYVGGCHVKWHDECADITCGTVFFAP